MMIKNIFGKFNYKKQTLAQDMVVTISGMIVTIPSTAVKKTGFLRDSVAKRLYSGKLEDIIWLKNHYDISFVNDADAVQKGDVQ